MWLCIPIQYDNIQKIILLEMHTYSYIGAMCKCYYVYT